jgi:aflatoxin B1 aldehyde reductase
MSPPSLILGTAGFGSSWTVESASELPPTLQKLGITRIDTAALYPVTAPGRAEQILGANKLASQGFSIDTKILYAGDGGGTMDEAAVHKSLSQSLDVLKTPSVCFCMSSQNILRNIRSDVCIG